MKQLTRAAALAAGSLLLAGAAQAATLQLDFDTDFSDFSDPGSASPSGTSPWLTALIDDGGSAGSATLTLTASDIGIADITQVYLNFDDALASTNLAITYASGPAEPTNIQTAVNTYQADGDGKFDILIDFGNDNFMENESIVFNINGTGAASAFVASDFNFLSDPAGEFKGPFYGAAKFQSTGNGEQSAWVAAVPVPGAVWLMGSALGMLGWMRRKRVVSAK